MRAKLKAFALRVSSFVPNQKEMIFVQLLPFAQTVLNESFLRREDLRLVDGHTGRERKEVGFENEKLKTIIVSLGQSCRPSVQGRFPPTGISNPILRVGDKKSKPILGRAIVNGEIVVGKDRKGVDASKTSQSPVVRLAGRFVTEGLLEEEEVRLGCLVRGENCKVALKTEIDQG